MIVYVLPTPQAVRPRQVAVFALVCSAEYRRALESYTYKQHLAASGLRDSSQTRILAAVKSLFKFASATLPGVFPANISSSLALPKLHGCLAERLLEPAQVQELLAVTRAQKKAPRRGWRQNAQEAQVLAERNRALVVAIYAAGVRRSELVGLRWRDCVPRTIPGEAKGQITVHGKGNKPAPLPYPQSLARTGGAAPGRPR